MGLIEVQDDVVLWIAAGEAVFHPVVDHEAALVRVMHHTIGRSEIEVVLLVRTTFFWRTKPLGDVFDAIVCVTKNLTHFFFGVFSLEVMFHVEINCLNAVTAVAQLMTIKFVFVAAKTNLRTTGTCDKIVGGQAGAVEIEGFPIV